MTDYYFLDRITGRNPNLRAGDADRERTAERLRKAHTEGRLDLDEFQQRLEISYRATTFGELDRLVRDLPRDEQDARRSFSRPGPGRWRIAPLLPILIALLVIAAASGHEHHVFWLWLPLVFVIWRVGWWRHRRGMAAPRRGLWLH